MTTSLNARVWLGLALASLGACSTAPKETTTILLVSLEPAKKEGKGLVLKKTEEPTVAYLDTIELSPNVMSVSRITHNEDPKLQLGPPVLSPVSDDLVYRIFENDDKHGFHGNIWLQGADSTARTQITVGNFLDDNPSFSPDGEVIVFSSNRTRKQADLWRIKTRGGGGITRITNSNAADYNPSISPNNEWVAYSSLLPDTRQPQIWTIEASGAMVTQLSEGNQPRISPDGTQILFVRPDPSSGKSQIWVMPVDGGQETQLTFSKGHDHIDPAWSPDGQWIVYASDEGLDARMLHNLDIWIMASDGSRATSLTTNGSRDDSPCWNWEGDMIYFRSNRGGHWNFWRFALSEEIIPSSGSVM